MRYVISADDFGVTPGVTDHILEAFDGGLLTNVSLIANGRAVERAAEEARKRPGLTLTVHLNFVEGAPLSPPEQVPALVGDDGDFDQSFGSLWAKSMLARGSERRELQDQLGREIGAQLDRAAALMGPDWERRVDSHVHVHAIPLVFDALLQVHRERPIRYIRTLEEPLFLSLDRRGSLKNYIGPNLAKNALLRRFTRRQKRALVKEGVAHNDFFVGILFTGNMSVDVARAALRHLGKYAPAESIVEFVLHPGSAVPGEEGVWPDRLSAFRAQYFSPWRKRERELLQDPAFRELFSQHQRHDAPPGSLDAVG